ncbi:unnamed protein product [[Candida] boidinii]|nr:unnamed protein product [[Candida] boidinii]
MSTINLSSVLIRQFSQGSKRQSAQFSKFAIASVSTALVGAAYYNNKKNGGNNQNSNNNNNNNNRNNNNGSGIASALALFGLFSSKVTTDSNNNQNIRQATSKIRSYEDYQNIYNDIATKIREEDDFDDGSYGPVLVRLAWHSSGSYDKNDPSEKKGGSYGGTMIFKKEQSDPANAGLSAGEKFLQSIGEKYPWLPKGDLITLGGVVAIQELSGPKIPWRPGRDNLTEAEVPPINRLPDASQEDGNYVRKVFYKMNFSDREIVALIGAHALGRCHTYNSGFDGPWTFSPTVFTNDFFKLLIGDKWTIRKWKGPRQYEDSTKSLMMLPADMCLIEDAKFHKYVEEFANSEELFFKEFSKAFSKLLELGIGFPKSTPTLVFKTLEEQEA